MGDDQMQAMRKVAGLAVSALGIGVLMVGVYFIQRGFAAEDEIKSQMADEAVTTTIDGVEYPVLDARTAMNQAQVIKSHTLDRYGPWQALERDSEERAVMLDGLTLRNSLYLARMGLDLSLMVKATGAVFAIIGLGLAVTGAAVYVLAARAVTAERRAPAGVAPAFGY